MYACDLVLISSSLMLLQKMNKICETEASDIDMVFNASKSMLLRVGSRYNRSCAHVGIGSNVIPTRQNILVSLFVPQN